MYEYVNGLSMRDSFPGLNIEAQTAVINHIASFHHSLLRANKQACLDIGITEYNPEKNKLGLEQHDLSTLSPAQEDLVRKASRLYKGSLAASLPQLLHNDAHDENIFIQDGTAVFIDFGDMIWRDVHYEFYNYVMKYPAHWEQIVSKYEALSGHTLDKARIVSIALLRYLRSLLDDLNTPLKREDAIEKFGYLRLLLGRYS